MSTNPTTTTTTVTPNEDDTTTMLAFVVSVDADTKMTNGKVERIPKPTFTERDMEIGSALIRVLRAGICNTDLEILQGYMGFTGVLGHEFVGIVEQVTTTSTANDWIGKRVCGDINVPCLRTGTCKVCHQEYDEKSCNMSRNHCPSRTVLGILNHNGTMAEYIKLPLQNLHMVPESIQDEEAVFAEPLAAACRIIEQNLVTSAEAPAIAILGDGKLGLMIAEVMGRQYLKNKQTTTTTTTKQQPPPILFGKHEHKLNLVKHTSGVETMLLPNILADNKNSNNHDVLNEYQHKYDIVIDATGNPNGLLLSTNLCRPMGTIILKSTCAVGVGEGNNGFNTAPFVINELSIVGSRCGPIPKALELLSLPNENTTTTTTTTTPPQTNIQPLQVQKYITQTFPLTQAKEAIEFAAQKSTMKVQIICSE